MQIRFSPPYFFHVHYQTLPHCFRTQVLLLQKNSPAPHLTKVTGKFESLVITIFSFSFSETYFMLFSFQRKDLKDMGNQKCRGIQYVRFLQDGTFHRSLLIFFNKNNFIPNSPWNLDICLLF